MQSQKISVALTAALAIFTTTLLVTGIPAVAQEKVLHSFGSGKDGTTPWGGVIFDSAGNLYGTTFAGGTGPCSIPQTGCGTIFELSPKAGGSWTEKVVHNFHGNDGWEPSGNLIFDGAGNLYGTTRQGGTGLCRYLSTEDHYLIGCGTVFELSPAAGGAWTEKVLYSFINNGTDGIEPTAGLVFDAAGNLYGTTFNGGLYDYGTVFELSPAGGGSWTETILHNFNQDGTDGIGPWAGLILNSGNLWGTTVGGGTTYNGTVFELTPTAGGSWTETIAHSLNDTAEGYNAQASVIFDTAGNLYTTASFGGEGGVDAEGSVFELSPGAGIWTETTLHNFNENGTDAATPVAGVIFDASGHVYGTTQFGGPRNVYGSVFELTPTPGGGWTEKILHDFGTGTDGVNPLAGLIFDTAGHLYGTTAGGGVYGNGTVFEVAH
jgi:uncharacterized repeat protein (TIGR03803 family)